MPKGAKARAKGDKGMRLTPSQKRAAEAPGSVAVTAGAGTGKTSMLAARYLHHVTVDGLSPLSVAAVTFTEKAADELRARIRKTLHKAAQPESTIAEVEAAQISTIHALAARICRDFYDLAGIPADFTVLDQTESPVWMWEKFEEAVSGIDPGIIDDLGFSWLTATLREFLDDPYTAQRALDLGSANWEALVQRESSAALESLLNCVAWADAQATITSIQGSSADRLEDARIAAINAMDRISAGENVATELEVLTKLAAHLGKASNWPPGGKESVGRCLKSLKRASQEVFDFASLAFGPDDVEVARRIDPLKAAFQQVRGFMAAEKLRERVLDFADLEHYALKVLEHESARTHYALRWRAFLVDEFQDTNPIQAEILELLTRDAALTIVGDEKQAIYGFRGADANVFTRVRQQISTEAEGLDVPLDRTFRAHNELVEQMNRIFDPVLGEIHQALQAERTETTLPAPYIRSAVVEDVKGTLPRHQQMIEARYIADQIKWLHNEQGVPFREIAIISRTWRPLDDYLRVLSASGIPAVHAGGGSLLDTREAKDVYALLSFLVDPTEDIPLVAVLRSPFFAVSDRDLYETAPFVAGAGWWNAIRGRPAFLKAVETLDTLIDAAMASSAERILALANKLTGYEAVIANLPFGSRRTADFRGLMELFRKLERRGRGDIFGTVRYMRELIETETVLPRPHLDVGDAVSLMTIHMAKGLEWRVVFVPDLANKENFSIPQILVDPEIGVSFQIEGDGYEMSEPAVYKLIKNKSRAKDRAEEHRLLYVAITRAKDMVFLTATKESGPGIDILRPGLDAAGIIDEIIPFDALRSIAPDPGVPEPMTVPAQLNTAPLSAGLSTIPATALTVFAKCPTRFNWQYVEGHPGLGEGSSTAMMIGELTHLALELDINDAASLRQHSGKGADMELERAIRFARSFREMPEFAAVRIGGNEKEVSFTKPFGPLTIIGTADVVGPDFVLDYKTDAEMDPDEHRFQIWAYARAFDKERGYIAYLAHNVLYEFGPDDLAEIDISVQSHLDNIAKGLYNATPSETVCGQCVYRQICKFRFEG
jgi:ATP-dependent helicase/nuclease subunit A